MLNRLLTPLVESCPGIPVIWLSSGVHIDAPSSGINLSDPSFAHTTTNGRYPFYAHAKLSMILLAHEFAKRESSRNIISVSVHPGVLQTNLARDDPAIMRFIVGRLVHPARFGALTMLYAGFSKEILENSGNGKYIAPFGQIGKASPIVDKAIEEGQGERLWKMLDNAIDEFC